MGRKLLREEFPDPNSALPPVKGIEKYLEDNMYLTGILHGSKDYKHSRRVGKTDIIDKMDIRSFILPQNWESEKKRVYETYGKNPDFSVV